MSTPHLDGASAGEPGAKHFALCVRVALITLTIGYGLDFLLGHWLVASSGTDASMGVSTSPSSEDPLAMMAFLSLAMLGLGHLLLLFGTLLWLLGNPGVLGKIGQNARAQLVVATGATGLLGMMCLYDGNRSITSDSITHVEALGLDLLATLAIGAAAWISTRGTPSEDLRRKLGAMLLATTITGVTIFANSGEQPWLVVVFGTSTIVALMRISQLLVAFENPPHADPDKTLPGPSAI